MDSNTLQSQIKKEAAIVLWRVILFITYYLGMILLGFCFLGMAIVITWGLWGVFKIQEHIGGRILWLIGMLTFAMWVFCIQVTWHLIKPLFIIRKRSIENAVEIYQKGCPELFALIEEVSMATGNKMPKHVYLNSEVNACVFYNSISIWSIFFPTGKNLMIGIGLLHGLNREEIKAILAHEFGHFSQKTMKVGTITYRLLLIIRDLIKTAQDQQRAAEAAKASDSDLSIFFISAGYMSLVSEWTIDLYNYIERKNRSLSRLMEYEADSVACKIVGTKTFISSLCKVPVISERFNLYENVIANLIMNRQYLYMFWDGYDIINEMLSNDENINISYKDSLSGIVGDYAKFPSKIKILDGWNTHPEIKDRIKYAIQIQDSNITTETTDPRGIVPLEKKNIIGMKMQEMIAKNLSDPVDLDELSEIKIEDFKIWVSEQFEKHRIPHFLYPFVDRDWDNFYYPSESDNQVSSDNPFNEENRLLLLELKQGITDWQLLDQITSWDSDIKQILYDGKEYSKNSDNMRISDTIEIHKKYLEELKTRVRPIDIQIYYYLKKQNSENDLVKAIYWALCFGHYKLQEMDKIAKGINKLISKRREGETGLGFMERDISNDVHVFLRSFDFKNVSTIFGNLKNEDGVTTDKLLQVWGNFAIRENISSADFHDAYLIAQDVYNLLKYIFEWGKSRWIDLIVNAYKNTKNATT